MSKVTFVLGAGASAHTGAPLMNNFLDRARDLYSAGLVSHTNEEHFKRVFSVISGLQRVHSKSQLDLNNIESIFTTLEMADVSGKLPGFTPNQIRDAIRSLKKVIVTTLEESIRFPKLIEFEFPFHGIDEISPEKLEQSACDMRKKGVYNTFAALLRDISVCEGVLPSIISFNYDVALEFALFLSNMRLDYGFDSLGSDEQKRSIRLHKLHGSLNWASQKRNPSFLSLEKYLEDVRFEDPDLPLPRGRSLLHPTFATLPIGSELGYFFPRSPKSMAPVEPLIVPPTRDKIAHYKKLSPVWQRAAKDLEETEYLYIIGYSLPETDAFFRQFYALGTAGKTLFKSIEVFNPDESGETESRFREMLGPAAKDRFKYFPMKFTKAIDSIRNAHNLLPSYDAMLEDHHDTLKNISIPEADEIRKEIFFEIHGRLRNIREIVFRIATMDEETFDKLTNVDTIMKMDEKAFPELLVRCKVIRNAENMRKAFEGAKDLDEKTVDKIIKMLRLHPPPSIR